MVVAIPHTCLEMAQPNSNDANRSIHAGDSSIRSKCQVTRPLSLRCQFLQSSSCEAPMGVGESGHRLHTNTWTREKVEIMMLKYSMALTWTIARGPGCCEATEKLSPRALFSRRRTAHSLFRSRSRSWRLTTTANIIITEKPVIQVSTHVSGQCARLTDVYVMSRFSW